MSIDRPAAPPPGVRDLLIEFLGAFVRRFDGWFAIAPLVSLMTDVGMDEVGVRMAVSRLKARGWLVAERRDGASGYALTPLAEEALEAGDAFIYGDRSLTGTETGWVLVSFSVPEQQRSRRHALKTRLVTAGFGHIGPGLLLAPAGMLAEARRIIDELEMQEYADVFTARYEGRDVAELVRRGWDLPALGAGYGRFIDFAESIHRGSAAIPPSDATAVASYLSVLHEWRLVAYSDPGLPLESLTGDSRGVRARRAFDDIVATFDGVALDCVSRYLGGSPPA